MGIKLKITAWVEVEAGDVEGAIDIVEDAILEESDSVHLIAMEIEETDGLVWGGEIDIPDPQ